MTSSEQHFSVAEIAASWGLCENTVRNLFAEEEGVIKLQSPRSLITRNSTRKPYTSLSISVSARDRVYARISAGFRSGFQRKSSGGRIK